MSDRWRVSLFRSSILLMMTSGAFGLLLAVPVHAQRPPIWEDYVGPMPRAIPAGDSLNEVYIDFLTDSVAYYYRYDRPEEFLSGPVMLDSGEAPEPFRVDGLTQILSPLPKARAVVNGIPSEPYLQLDQPFVCGETARYLAEGMDAFHMFEDHRPGTHGFKQYSTSMYDRKNGNLACVISTDRTKDWPLWRVLDNDRLGPNCRDIVKMTFSAAGRLAYVGLSHEDNKWRLYLDQEPGPAFDELSTFRFSPDGLRYFYTAANGFQNLYLWRIIIDGREHKDFDALIKNSFHFSPDSRRFAYGVFHGDKLRYIVDDQPQPEYDRLESGSFRFSSDGTQFGYVATSNGKAILVINDGTDDAISGPFDAIETTEEMFGADGRSCFVAVSGEQRMIQCAGEKPLPFAKIDRVRFSPDGKRLAYVGRRLESDPPRYCVVVDGESGPDHESVTQLKFSADGRRLAYLAHAEDKARVYLDGRQVGVDFDRVESFEFSPDSRRFAVRGARGEAELVEMDDELVLIHKYDTYASAPLIDTTIHFSPDSQHYAYWANELDGLVMVYDGERTPPYERVLRQQLKFVSDACAQGFAVRDGELLRVLVGELPNQQRQDRNQSADHWREMGKAAETEGNDLLAAACFRKGASAGDAYCQYRIGRYYVAGTELGTDPSKGYYWTKQAAEQDFVPGINNVGNCYRGGFGVDQDLEEAVRWFRQAADRGLADAQVRLGDAYRRGEGVPKNLGEATRWYSKAAEQGHVLGQYWTARHYRRAEGVPQDFKVAMQWYLKAAEQQDPDAALEVAYMIANGQGVRANQNVVLDWYLMAARLGNANGRERVLSRLGYDAGDRAMEAWFSESRDVVRRMQRVGERMLYYACFELELPVPEVDHLLSLYIPVVLFTDEELNAAKSDSGVINPARLPGRKIEDMRPLSDEQWNRWKDRPDAIPIGVPPYLIFCSGLEGTPAGTRTAVRKYAEKYYLDRAR